jgi:elongator complex protein 1
MQQEEMEDTKGRIQKYDVRLKEVRERRAAMAAALDEGEDERQAPGEFDDTASEGGSSMVSGLSAYTQGSVGGASTAASTGRQASTVGGRLPQKKQRKVR